MNGSSGTVLVVEDDNNYRYYLEELLSRNSFDVISALEGSEGYEKAQASIPDLIITDLKMQGMGGFEFCEKILADKFTSHIPIIILTGLDGDRNLEKGLERGAVDYITKPVKSEVLATKVKNILSLRKKLEQKNWANILEKTFDESDLSEDEEFLQSLYRVVAENIDRYDFGVFDLASALNVSERTLYRRVKELTDTPVAGLIREVRLQRARELVKDGSVKTYSELAGMVGYKSTKQFKKAFEKRFGRLPQT